MTHVTQTETATPKTRPLVRDDRPADPGEPVIILTHSESIAVDAVGSGDTGGIRIFLPLVKNYAWILHRLVWDVRGDHSVRWNQGMLTFFFSDSPNLAPQQTTEMEVPASPNSTRTAENTKLVLHQIGGGLADLPTTDEGGVSNAFPPTFLQWGIEEAVLQPSISMNCPTADTNAVSLTMISLWLGFPINQATFGQMYRSFPPLS